MSQVETLQVTLVTQVQILLKWLKCLLQFSASSNEVCFAQWEALLLAGPKYHPPEGLVECWVANQMNLMILCLKKFIPC